MDRVLVLPLLFLALPLLTALAAPMLGSASAAFKAVGITAYQVAARSILLGITSASCISPAPRTFVKSVPFNIAHVLRIHALHIEGDAARGGGILRRVCACAALQEVVQHAHV